MLRNYKELKVWEKSYQLCLEVYRITKGFPKMEIYGLISQMRRSANPNSFISAVVGDRF
jgi:23S rRNA-intervening sequence protein